MSQDVGKTFVSDCTRSTVFDSDLGVFGIYQTIRCISSKLKNLTGYIEWWRKPHQSTVNHEIGV
jgi:hypothetical protein